MKRVSRHVGVQDRDVGVRCSIREIQGHDMRLVYVRYLLIMVRAQLLCAWHLPLWWAAVGSRQISPVTAFIAENAAQRKWQNNYDCIEHNVQPQKSSVQLIEPDEVIDRVLFAFNGQKILDYFASNEQAET